MSFWPVSKTCGGCTALVNLRDQFHSCSDFCGSLGLTCLNAAENTMGTCKHQARRSCDSHYTQYKGEKNSALCTCAQESKICEIMIYGKKFCLRYDRLHFNYFD